MSEQGARCGRRQRVPRMERQEASGSSHGPARPGTPTALTALGPGSLARRLADRKASLTEPRTLRGASRRSIPLPFGREKENRETGAPGRPKTKPRDGGALAEAAADTKGASLWCSRNSPRHSSSTRSAAGKTGQSSDVFGSTLTNVGLLAFPPCSRRGAPQAPRFLLGRACRKNRLKKRLFPGRFTSLMSLTSFAPPFLRSSTTLRL